MRDFDFRVLSASPGWCSRSLLADESRGCNANASSERSGVSVAAAVGASGLQHAAENAEKEVFVPKKHSGRYRTELTLWYFDKYLIFCFGTFLKKRPEQQIKIWDTHDSVIRLQFFPSIINFIETQNWMYPNEWKPVKDEDLRLVLFLWCLFLKSFINQCFNLAVREETLWRHLVSMFCKSSHDLGGGILIKHVSNHICLFNCQQLCLVAV